jgi:hypothetical protein
MTVVLRSCLLVAVAIALAGLSARAADVDDVKERLFQAKKEYDAETQKFRAAVTDVLDKREDAARKAGDKKAIDAVKADRDRFEKNGEPPRDMPKALLTQAGAARAKLDKAYSAAVKDLVKLKEDVVAEAIEKEQQKFFVESVMLFGKKTYLVTLKHYDLKVPGGWFSNDGTILGYKVKQNGEHAAHTIFLHPPDKGAGQVKYPLNGRWLALRTSIGVPRIEDTEGGPKSALTFEVLGDGKSLWKSEPVTKLDEFQACDVRVEKVKVLTLLVHAADSSARGRAVWLEPILID